MPGNNQNDIGTQQAAQPVNASPQTEPGTEGNQFVSVDQFQQALQDMERKVQGIVDKNISRVDKRVAEASTKAQEAVEMLKSTGMQITPEQEAALRDKAVIRALQTEQGHDQVSTPGVSQNKAQGFDLPTRQEPVDPITATAMQMMTSAGVQIDEGDPEFQTLNLKTQNPYEFLTSVQTAITAKKERTSKKQTINPAAMPTVTGQGTGTTLEAQYRAELAKVRQGDVEAIFALKMKYRSAGLKI